MKRLLYMLFWVGTLGVMLWTFMALLFGYEIPRGAAYLAVGFMMMTAFDKVFCLALDFRDRRAFRKEDAESRLDFRRSVR